MNAGTAQHAAAGSVMSTQLFNTTGIIVLSMNNMTANGSTPEQAEQRMHDRQIQGQINTS
jgi:hypothetical protein